MVSAQANLRLSLCLAFVAGCVLFSSYTQYVFHGPAPAVTLLFGLVLLIEPIRTFQKAKGGA